MKDIYIAPGLLKDHAKDNKMSEDEARKNITDRIFELTAFYEADKSLLYWDKRDRTCFNALLQNHLVDRETKNHMLRDLAGCDEVLLPLRDLLKFAITCTSRARFLVRISSFLEKLEARDLGLFADCISSLKRWTQQGKPADPKENDIFLLGVFDDVMGHVPAEISAELKSEYLADRFGKLMKVVERVNKGEKI